MADYRFNNWRMAHRDAYGVVYRPSAGTLARRLLAALPLVVLVGLCGYGLIETAKLGKPDSRPISVHPAVTSMTRAMRDHYTEEEWNEVLEELDAKKAQRDYERQLRYVRVHNTLVVGTASLGGLILGVAILPMLWMRLSIGVDAYGNLTVRHIKGFLPSRRTLPIDTFESINVATLGRQTVLRGRYTRSEIARGPQRRAWRIALVDKVAGLDPGYGGELNFWPHEDAGGLSAAPNESQPRPVQELIKALEELTRLPVTYGAANLSPEQVQAMLHGSEFRHRSTQEFRFRNADGTEQVYHSVDELPPHLAAKAAAALENARRTGEHPAPDHSITVTDQNGRTHTFNSPDEMPPHLRTIYDQFHQNE